MGFEVPVRERRSAPSGMRGLVPAFGFAGRLTRGHGRSACLWSGKGRAALCRLRKPRRVGRTPRLRQPGLERRTSNVELRMDGGQNRMIHVDGMAFAAERDFGIHKEVFCGEIHIRVRQARASQRCVSASRFRAKKNSRGACRAGERVNGSANWTLGCAGPAAARRGAKPVQNSGLGFPDS